MNENFLQKLNCIFDKSNENRFVESPGLLPSLNENLFKIQNFEIFGNTR